MEQQSDLTINSADAGRRQIADLKAVLTSTQSTASQKATAAAQLERYSVAVKRAVELGHPADADWTVIFAVFQMERSEYKTAEPQPAVNGVPIHG